MSTDTMKRTARRALGAFTAIALTLGLSSALQAQERQEMQHETTVVITKDQLREALSQPQVELEELRGIQGLKLGHVVVVDANTVLETDEELVTLRQEHGEVITTYRTELEGNAIVAEALSKQDLMVGDVIAIFVTERAKAGEAEQADPETGAHKTVYVVVSGQAAATEEPGSDR